MVKKIRGWILSSIVLLIGFAGCANQQATPSAIASPTELPLVGRLSFAGSTTVQPLVGQLGDVFKELHPEVQLEIAAGGSVVGIQAVHEGTVDIGMASRALKPEEAEGITQYQIAVDVIAIIVHPSNPVKALTLAQLAAIYRGEVTNWSELDGLDEEIVPVIREESSGTRGAFDELVLEKETPSAPGIVTAITAGDVAATVSNNPASIGYIGFGNFEDDIAVVAIDNVLPSKQTARDGSYTIMRPLLLLTGPLSQPLSEDYINYVLSAEGQAKVEEFGWIPVN